MCFHVTMDKEQVFPRGFLVGRMLLYVESLARYHTKYHFAIPTSARAISRYHIGADRLFSAVSQLAAHQITTVGGLQAETNASTLFIIF